MCFYPDKDKFGNFYLDKKERQKCFLLTNAFILIFEFVKMI